MKEVIQLVIDGGEYDLADMLAKIEREWVLGHLAEGDRDALIESARANAKPEGSMGPVAERVTAVETALRELTARMDKLEGAEPPLEQYPDFVLGKSYYKGDKISYGGQRFECIYTDGLPCVWSPADYPDGWKLIG